MILSEYCKATLFCLVFDGPAPRTVVYIQAGTKVAAIRKAMDAIICLQDVSISEVALTHVASYQDLIAEGHADIESFRVFEASWFGEPDDDWVHAPLLLTNDASLLQVWSAVQFEMRAGQANRMLRVPLFDSMKRRVAR